MILAPEERQKGDQSPLGRTVQLRRMLQRDGRMLRIVTTSRSAILAGTPHFVCLFQRRGDCQSSVKLLPRESAREYNPDSVVFVAVEETILPIGTAFHERTF